MFCRIKDFRRIATRYDRLESNFLAALAPSVGFRTTDAVWNAKREGRDTRKAVLLECSIVSGNLVPWRRTIQAKLSS